MSAAKQIFIALITIAFLGTIANWMLKLHDTNLGRNESQVKVRIQQLQDECERKLSAQKEEFQKSWNKEMKKLESKYQTGPDKVLNKSPTDTSDGNTELAEEVRLLRAKLDDVTNHFNEYKSKMEKISTPDKDHKKSTLIRHAKGKKATVS